MNVYHFFTFYILILLRKNNLNPVIHFFGFNGIAKYWSTEMIMQCNKLPIIYFKKCNDFFGPLHLSHAAD